MEGGKQNRSSTIYFLGTIHKAHLVNDRYSLGYLKAAIEHIRPQLLMVEIRPDAFLRNELSDGPFEMSYLTLLAHDLKITVEGVDWFDDQSADENTSQNNLEALEEEMASLLSSYSYEWPPSYLDAHTFEYVDFVQAVHETRIRYLGDSGDGNWTQRNLWIAHNIQNAVAKHRPQKALVAIGVEHLSSLIRQLEKNDNLSCCLSPPVTPLEPGEYAATDAVLESWDAGVIQLKQRTRTLTNEDVHQRILQKIEYWQQAIKQKGVAK